MDSTEEERMAAGTGGEMRPLQGSGRLRCGSSGDLRSACWPHRLDWQWQPTSRIWIRHRDNLPGLKKPRPGPISPDRFMELFTATCVPLHVGAACPCPWVRPAGRRVVEVTDCSRCLNRSRRVKGRTAGSGGVAR
jgi:hypothetical protein